MGRRRKNPFPKWMLEPWLAWRLLFGKDKKEKEQPRDPRVDN